MYNPSVTRNIIPWQSYHIINTLHSQLKKWNTNEDNMMYDCDIPRQYFSQEIYNCYRLKESANQSSPLNNKFISTCQKGTSGILHASYTTVVYVKLVSFLAICLWSKFHDHNTQRIVTKLFIWIEADLHTSVLYFACICNSSLCSSSYPQKVFDTYKHTCVH